MTFLELCQAAAVDSGLISDSNNITTAAGAQTGRKARIIRAVVQAWEDIQKARNDWTFMRAQFSANLVIGQSSYSAAELGIATRFRTFFRDQDAAGFLPHSIYDATIGVSDQSGLSEVSFEVWQMVYGRGQQQQGRPTDYALVGQKFNVGMVPDKAYAIRGWYRKAPQTLAADADVPDVPSHHHTVIKWKAIMDLHGADGAFADRLVAQKRYGDDYRALVDEQTDPLTMGDALA